MQNPTPGKRSRASRLSQLNKAIRVCSEFVRANHCSRVSILVSYEKDKKECTEVLTIGINNDLPIPVQELHDFFHRYGEQLICERLLLNENLKQ